MGLVKEPLEIDFYVDPTPLTKEEEKSISDFIQADKLKRSVKVKVRLRKQRSEHDCCQKTC